MSFAIDYIYREGAPPLGLEVAIQDFTKAWLQHSAQDHFFCHTPDPQSFLKFSELAREQEGNDKKGCTQLNPRGPLKALNDISCLFMPDPDLSGAIWRRSQKGGPSYATCGLVHSMSGDQAMKVVSDLCLLPSHGADALICPSKAIKDSVKRVWQVHEEYLARRFDCTFKCPVQTPVIPIGIDTKKFENLATPELRKAQREALGVAENEVVILFVGRLSFVTKAHPLPLLLAAEKAARQSKKKIRLVFYGYFFPQQDMEKHFAELMKDFGLAPLTCQIIQNTDPRFPHGLWAAGDIFTSLVDNVQESFGLTPIEAMACGLPPVVTDWDGYRDAVRNGLDGFLIPTYAPPAQTGMDVARDFFNTRNYGRYLMGVAQSTAIDIDAATKAFVTLADDVHLREKMGREAKARAQNVYDWSKIIPSYEALWEKLGEERLRYASRMPVPPNWQAITPSFTNPWHSFDSFPSKRLAPQDKLQVVMTGEEIEAVFKHEMNFIMPTLLLPKELVRGLIDTIEAKGFITVQDLLSIAPESEKDSIWRTALWLLKHGICKLT